MIKPGETASRRIPSCLKLLVKVAGPNLEPHLVDAPVHRHTEVRGGRLCVLSLKPPLRAQVLVHDS